MTNEQAKSINDFLENFLVDPAWVDKIVCEWSMNTENPLGTALHQEALVDRLSYLLSAELRGRFMRKHCGPPKELGAIVFNQDGTETKTGILKDSDPK